MNDFKDQDQASYTADPDAVDLTVIIETYKALLAGDNLPDRVAVQTEDLRQILAHITTLCSALSYEVTRRVPSKSFGSLIPKAENEALKAKLSQAEAALARYEYTDHFTGETRIIVQPVDVVAVRDIALLNEARELAFTAISQMRAAHISCNDLTMKAETLVRNISSAIRALQPNPDANSHVCQSKTIGDVIHNAVDECGVNSFASKMKDKLAIKRQQGRSGWWDMLDRELSAILRQCVEKGDPVDVANLCMMLSENGQSISPAEPVYQWQDITTIGEREHGRLIIVGTRDGKGRWCATIRRTTRVIEERNSSITGALKNTMRLKWEPTHFIELTALNSVAGR